MRGAEVAVGSLPLAGRVRVGGWEPEYWDFRHPHLASPVKGEEPRGGCDEMVPYV